MTNFAAIVISNIDNKDTIDTLYNLDLITSIWNNSVELVSYLNNLLNDGKISIHVYVGKEWNSFMQNLNNGEVNLGGGDLIFFTQIKDC